MKKYYTKILTECPNILVRKFKIRENVNNIGESIGMALKQFGGIRLDEHLIFELFQTHYKSL